MDSEGRRGTWLAEEVGVHASLVSRWMNGRRMPSAENQTKIAKALGRGRDDLFSGRACLPNQARATPEEG